MAHKILQPVLKITDSRGDEVFVKAYEPGEGPEADVVLTLAPYADAAGVYLTADDVEALLAFVRDEVSLS